MTRKHFRDMSVDFHIWAVRKQRFRYPVSFTTYSPCTAAEMEWNIDLFERHEMIWDDVKWKMRWRKKKKRWRSWDLRVCWSPKILPEILQERLANHGRNFQDSFQDSSRVVPGFFRDSSKILAKLLPRRLTKILPKTLRKFLQDSPKTRSRIANA